ncbi:MAG: hypothetical protein IPO87_14615 [Flavobacteriales bacterium]|nr:hypothetical protein [Flavobacteriales bacterium]
MKTNIRATYKRRLMHLRELVNDHDPIGLIAGGAPLDEYDMESSSMLPRISPGQSVDEIHDLVYDVFTKYFGTDGVSGTRIAYTLIAQDIHDWINSTEF